MKDAKQVTDRDMIRTLTTYIWPRGDTREERDVRRRVVTALGLMLGGKVSSHFINRRTGALSKTIGDID